LLITVTFVHSEAHPMHLRKNERYEGALPEMMNTIGFDRVGYGPMTFRKRT